SIVAALADIIIIGICVARLHSAEVAAVFYIGSEMIRSVSRYPWPLIVGADPSAVVFRAACTVARHEFLIKSEKDRILLGGEIFLKPGRYIRTVGRNNHLCALASRKRVRSPRNCHIAKFVIPTASSQPVGRRGRVRLEVICIDDVGSGADVGVSRVISGNAVVARGKRRWSSSKGYLADA